MEWDERYARRAAVAMCERAGVPETVGELLRLGSNAVFALGEAYVLRITPPGTGRAGVQQGACHYNCVSHGWTKIGRCDRHSAGKGTICESGHQCR